jgi:PAS domain S-box-containing protein
MKSSTSSTPVMVQEFWRGDLRRILHASIFFSLGVGLLGLLGVYLIRAPGWERLQTISWLILGVSVGLWLLLKRGYFWPAVYGMVLGYAGIAVYGAWFGIGVRGTAYAAFPLMVIYAAVLLNRRAGYLVAGAAALFGLGLVWANQAGWLVNAARPMAEMAVWANVSTYFFATAVILDIVLRQVDSALGRQACAEEALRQLNAELEQRIEERTAQLAESEAHYRLIAENASDVIWTMDLDMNITYVSPSAARTRGYTLAEIMEQSLAEILTPASHQYALQVWAEEMSKASLHKNADDFRLLELEFVRKNGSTYWSEVKVGFLRDEQGELIGLLGVGRDIDQRKQAETRDRQRREMLEKVIALGQTVTQHTDLQHCLRQIHQSIKHELGFDRVGLVMYDSDTNQLRETLVPDPVGEIEDSNWYLRAIVEHETWNAVMKTPKGLTIIEELSPSPPSESDDKTRPKRQHATLAAWAGDKPVALIAVDNALSRLPLTEEKLDALKLFAGYAGLAIENARWNASLEQRIVERTTELEEANRELQDFTYTIAHDLRAPARAMIGFSRLLQEEYAPHLDTNGQHYLNRVNYGARRMGQMIDELLAFTRLGRQTLRKESVNMLALVHQVLEEFEPERVERQIEIVVGNLPDEQADPEMVEQVWRHLLDNAFKFTRPLTRARIEIGALENKEGAQFFVRDNGVGFESQYAQKLFGVFQRLHLEEEFEGTGMGLAIVHRIVQRHHGRIWAEGEIHQGATFYFTLRAATPHV